MFVYQRVYSGDFFSTYQNKAESESMFTGNPKHFPSKISPSIRGSRHHAVLVPLWWHALRAPHGVAGLPPTCGHFKWEVLKGK